ncbi:MAG TPA: hypothetical protein P5244_05135 [Syntrophales bacterium]|nr:hypothetical protein [Syntrophales bacterium]HRS97812.1 hypothetical protein [Smithella sp.]
MDRGDTFLIKCRDNSILDLCIVPDEQEILEGGQIRHKDVELLRSFACRSIGDLKRDASVSAQGLLLLGEIKNINSKEPIFDLMDYAVENGETTSQRIQIIAHNIMGVFTLSERHSRIRMQITSRFDNPEGEQPFLSWLLKKVCSINQTHYLPASAGNFWNFLLEILFWAKLASARKVGLYRQYVKQEYNDLKFKGRLDMDRHILRNFPLKDKIAYSRREICYDNPINHLLRYAIAICERDFGHEMASPDAAQMAMAIKTETVTWRRDALNKVLSNKDVVRELRHPFYAEFYEDLRVLSLMLIDKMGVELYANKTIPKNARQINGVVFDGAWLWEAFLAKLLPAEWVHANPETGAHKIFALRRKDGKQTRELYPDFRLPVDGHSQLASVILDAKYKRGDSSEGLSVRREDMYQCLGYMLLTGATAGGVIYPPSLPGDPGDQDEGENNHVNCPDERIWRCYTFKYLGDLPPENFNKGMLEQEKKFRAFVCMMEEQSAAILCQRDKK